MLEPAVCHQWTPARSRDRGPGAALALDAPRSADVVRVARLAPAGTDGESLTVVLGGDGRVSLHVRRTLERGVGPEDRHGEELLLGLLPRLGWAHR